MDINAEVATRVMGWEVLTMEPGARYYRDPNQQGEAAMGNLPDFLLKDNDLLRNAMRDRGYGLSIMEKPPDVDKGRGRYFVATYTGRDKTVQTAQCDENLAVCVAALKVFGFRISNDEA